MNMEKLMDEEGIKSFTASFFPFNNVYIDSATAAFASDLSSSVVPFNADDSMVNFSYLEPPLLSCPSPATSIDTSSTTPEEDESSLPRVVVVEQPPVEVRTRTANEKRAFSCTVQVIGTFKPQHITQVGIDLGYATGGIGRPNQNILGGNKIAKIGEDGTVHFELSMSEASTKHKGNDFVLEFFLITDDNKRFSSSSSHCWTSQPFYAYSNQKVLARRRNVEIRAISRPRGGSRGGEQMHVIGSPFISSPSLQVRVSTAHGDVTVSGTNIELYSESVLFFTLPPYPISTPMLDGVELRAQVRVSNDGRYFSNPVDFTYIVENSAKRLRSRF
eukprot:TRINITY_DN2889_c0_g1_i1.p1 TRINITY_DN2889_c0_g1~~TRINITY_DN2889_c0_g1_i1.p1  ORF type:complete len:331 (-),score=69.05 TRINITY_DN2889_c0_g1_i1:95-1087(-)